MVNKIKQLRSRLEQEKGALSRINRDIESCNETIQTLEYRYEHIQKARAVIQTVAQQTQKQLEYHISGLVTTALAAVFDDPYNFVVQFNQRRNRTECDLLFERDGNSWYPLREEASGGGPIDVAAFALRVAFMSMEKPKRRSTLLLDQPFSNLSPDRQNLASQMVKEISKRLGLQIIMISHAEGIIDSADKIFEVSKQGDISHVSIV